jgi:pimeloyl-ACP methyl ester carboxylesterase
MPEGSAGSARTASVVTLAAAAAILAGAMTARRRWSRGQAVLQRRTGVSAHGMEFEAVGDGPHTLLFIGGGPGSEILTGTMATVMSGQYLPYVRAGYTVWNVTRPRHMPPGHSVSDMAVDYARFIEDELGGRVDLVVGESYGGMVAQHLAADHPALVGRVVLALAAATITDSGKDLDVRWATARAEGRHAAAGTVFLEYLVPGAERAGLRRRLGPLVGRVFAGSPVPAGDLLVEAQAEAAFDARDVLARIQAPVLMLCGDEDEFFSRESVEETADRIPDSTVVWYRGMSHLRAAMSRRIPSDVLAWVPATEPRPST